MTGRLTPMVMGDFIKDEPPAGGGGQRRLFGSCTWYLEFLANAMVLL